MDYNDLNDIEVKQLINTLKYPKKIDSYKDCFSKVASMFEKIRISEPIADEDNDLEYLLHVYKGRFSDSFSIHLRFKEFNHHLVRIDINPHNRHYNPDGSLIDESHIHIYNNQCEKRDAIAIPIKDSDFPNINNLVNAFAEFVRYTHIREKEGD